MPSGRQAAAAFLAGAIGACAILALALSQPAAREEAGSGRARFAVAVSPASASLLEDPAVRSRLDVRRLPSTDDLIGAMTHLDADGVILDRDTLTSMTVAGIAELLRSGRVVATVGVDAQEVQHLAGLSPSFTPHAWPRPYFSVLLVTDRSSRGTSMDFSGTVFASILTERARQARAERTPSPAATPTRSIP